ncbi:MAG: M12 family metallo-peptidase [Gemmatimonadota bacterium]|nr:M12 family metallo-peptidase [Gemmatimonadota bacterium]
MKHHTVTHISGWIVLAVVFLVSMSQTDAATINTGAEGVAFCRVIDTRGVSGPTGSAAKPVFLDEDVPNTVRLVYFLPNDRLFRPEVVESMKSTILQIQGLFAAEMERHGHGNRTFRFETDSQGGPLVHRVDGKHPSAHYYNSAGDRRETWQALGRSRIEIIVRDFGSDTVPSLGGPAGGVTYRSGGAHQSYATVLVPSSFSWRVLAHELGHAFELEHDFRDDEYIMSYGGGTPARLSACAAEFLSIRGFFNDGVYWSQKARSTTIDLLSPLAYRPESRNIPIRAEFNSAQGLRQVILYTETTFGHGACGYPEVKACRSFSGERTAVAEFDYDGLIPSNSLTSLASPIMHQTDLWAVDSSGRVSVLYVPLHQTSERHIGSLEETPIRALAYSPSTGALVYAADYEAVKSWDLQTREPITSFGAEHSAIGVAVSPDGSTLATHHNTTVKVWDVSTGANTLTFEVQHWGNSSFKSVAFSPPDGAILAAQSGESTVKLWNLATRGNFSDLDHAASISSMAFSPDGTRLVTASTKGTVHYWDPKTGEHMTSWEGHRGWVGAVAFSPPDGATLATKAGWDGTVKLWDVLTERHLATFYNQGGGKPTAFSPDGAILACGSHELVRLWHVATRSQIDSLAHKGYVDVIAFSPDGKTLASGTTRGIELWDAVEWQPRPSALTVVSGDGQQDRPGARLPGALIVEIRDQYGQPIRDILVAFSVTQGNGALTTANATADSTGRAATTLTLGGERGAVKVSASVPGLDAVLFTATAEVSPDLNDDGKVDHSDFALLARAFGTNDPGCDLDGSGTVDFADLLIFAEHLGRTATN